MQKDNRWYMAKQKTDAIREQLFRKAAPRNYSSSTQWGYSDSMSPGDKSKQALITLTCCAQYMAVSMPGLVRFDRSDVPNGCIFDALLWVPTVYNSS